MNSVNFNFQNIYQINSAYVEEMFARFQSNPESVDPQWRAYFHGVADGCKIGKEYCADYQSVAFELSAAQLTCAYKSFGHLKAKINPLESDLLSARSQDSRVANLFDLNTYHLTENDRTRMTYAGRLIGLPNPIRLDALIHKLEEIFCGTVGAEIEHITSIEERTWLYSEFIELKNQPVSLETRKQMFVELASADALEKTIATKYIGKKRFSIEGADAQLVAAESAIDELARLGTKEFQIAIAHRGRLNFLVNLVGKPLANLFAEFEGKTNSDFSNQGDVKYHYGYESLKKTRSGFEVRIGLSANPSHLEYVDAIVMGETRAIQTLYHNSDTSKAAALIFHGDAAVAGQGIVYEIAELMSLAGYQVGGIIHIVANNQIGFTTNPKDARSSIYCTSVAKVTDSPVFHVNADDCESLHNIMVLAARYRTQFKKDIYIDLLCFRRFGHNESDEPSFTQPVLYKIIKEKPPAYEIYLKELVKNNHFTENELSTIYHKFRTEMNAIYDKFKADNIHVKQFKPNREAGKLVFASEEDILQSVDTRVELERLKQVAASIIKYPNTFHINPKIERLVVHERQKMIMGEKPLDWGMAEMLAYASLIDEGYSIRLTGEDTQRGTFSHRHAIFVDVENEKEFSPLGSINPNAKVEVINSPLSEEGCLGYEYGYAIIAVNTLILWEAQFGDFVNGAQVIIDQFIVSGETKWCQQQGLVLLLPHGMEGQGSEHSSAGIERFLQLCAQGNMQVCCLTQAAQIFHVFRRQLKRNFRKPLIIMTPKSFLRSPRIGTSLAELAQSQFEEILNDPRIANPDAVKRVLFCTGKIALDLFEALEKDNFKSLKESVAIIRIEQLYPLHIQKLTKIVSNYSKAELFAWVQEEPNNKGAYQHLHHELTQVINKISPNRLLLYFGRSRRASPAVGFENLHLIEQKQVIDSALTHKESTYI